jgi:hypothetical protein
MDAASVAHRLSELAWPSTIRRITTHPRCPRTLFVVVTQKDDLEWFAKAVREFCNWGADVTHPSVWAGDASRTGPAIWTHVPARLPNEVVSVAFPDRAAQRLPGIRFEIILHEPRVATMSERRHVLKRAPDEALAQLVHHCVADWEGLVDPLSLGGVEHDVPDWVDNQPPIRELTMVWAVPFEVSCIVRDPARERHIECVAGARSHRVESRRICVCARGKGTVLDRAARFGHVRLQPPIGGGLGVDSRIDRRRDGQGPARSQLEESAGVYRACERARRRLRPASQRSVIRRKAPSDASCTGTRSPGH